MKIKITPLHLRKKRSSKEDKLYYQKEIEKLNEGFEKLIEDLDELKKHLERMGDQKY